VNIVQRAHAWKALGYPLQPEEGLCACLPTGGRNLYQDVSPFNQDSTSAPIDFAQLDRPALAVRFGRSQAHDDRHAAITA
jgi:hypothetical protein